MSVLSSQSNESGAPVPNEAVQALPKPFWRRHLALIIGLGTMAVALPIIFARRPDVMRSTIPTIAPDNWGWVALGLMGVFASFVCSAVVLASLSTVKLPLFASVMAQWAGAASKLVTPASAGAMGVNVRFLTKHGASVSSAVTTVAATQVAQLGLTGVLVAVFLPAANATPRIKVPEGPGYWVAGAIAIAIVGALAWVRWKHGQPLTHIVRQWIISGWSTLRVSVQSPTRMAGAILGSLGLTFSLAVCMWSMTHAVGGESTFLVAAVVMMVGAGLGAFVPTPGGVGGVEGAMVALYFAAGQPYDVAMQSVLLFRLLTFWLPAPLGMLAAVWLRTRKQL